MLFISSKNNKNTFKRILAVKLADFGDALLIEPSLRTIHKNYSAARLDVLTTKSALPALERLPYLNKVILFDKYQFDNPRAAFSWANLQALAKFALQLATTRYDAVIFFHHLTTRWGALKFAALAIATLAPVRIGLDNKTGRAWFLNKTVSDKGFGYAGQSEMAYWQHLVETLVGPNVSNLTEAEKKPNFVITPEERDAARKWLPLTGQEPRNRLVIAIYPGSGDYALARRWLPAYFAKVAVALCEEFDAHIVLLGSKSELAVSKQVQSLMGRPATLATGQTTLYEAAAMLENCDLFIGNDGGLLHLAAAMNVPVVGIFGPTNAVAWRPYGWEATNEVARAAIVQAPLDLACRPCLYRDKKLGQRLGCAPRPCLTEITPEQVIKAARKILAENLKPAAANFVD